MSYTERPTRLMAALCLEHGITMAVTRKAEPRDGWPAKATHWRALLKRPGRANIATEYSMGSAHTGQPKLVDVLACLISDAQCGRDTTFENFCSDFGYDTDSRKAHATWLVCVETDAKIAAFLGAEREAFETLAAEL